VVTNTENNISPEDGDSMFLLNMGNNLQGYTVASKKTTIDIFIALKTSNLRYERVLLPLTAINPVLQFLDQ
jgi:hypothetical protein